MAAPNSPPVNGDRPEVRLVTWVLTTADPTGNAVSFPQHADICWQAIGTFGGATVAAQGSNTDVDADFCPMTNVSGGAAATFTALGIKQTIERPLFVRPKLTTVGVGASITVTAMLRKQPAH